MSEILEFPRWRYHQDCPEGKIIYSAEEFQALGPGWVDSPAKLEPAEAPVLPVCKYSPSEEEPAIEEPIEEEKPKIQKPKKKGK